MIKIIGTPNIEMLREVMKQVAYEIYVINKKESKGEKVHV